MQNLQVGFTQLIHKGIKLGFSGQMSIGGLSQILRAQRVGEGNPGALTDIGVRNKAGNRGWPIGLYV